MTTLTVVTPPSSIQGVDAVGADPADSLGNWAVWTPEIEHLASKILEWMGLDLPGGCVSGLQRCGKSWAVDYLAGSAEDYFGSKVLVSRFIAQENLADREIAWVGEMLMQNGVIAQARTSARLKKRLLDWFHEMLQALAAQRVLLVIDEAQNLSRFHHGQLMYLYNLLEKERMRPFVLLIGQPELEAIAASYSTMNEVQVTGRFYERMHEFKGIGMEHVGQVLEGFEQASVIDGVEQPCGLERLFPEYWRAGWRISAWAPSIVAAMIALAQQHSLPGVPRLPMMHLRALVIGGLRAMQRTGERWDRLSSDFLAGLLAQTGLADAIERYHPSATMRPKKSK